LQVRELRAAVNWDVAIESGTSHHAYETIGEAVSQLEPEEQITPAKSELDTEVPATSTTTERVAAVEVSHTQLISRI